MLLCVVVVWPPCDCVESVGHRLCIRFVVGVSGSGKVSDIFHKILRKGHLRSSIVVSEPPERVSGHQGRPEQIGKVLPVHTPKARIVVTVFGLMCKDVEIGSLRTLGMEQSNLCDRGDDKGIGEDVHQGLEQTDWMEEGTSPVGVFVQYC